MTYGGIPIMDSQFAVYVFEVKSDCEFGHMQLPGDALVRVAAGQEFEDLRFTPRQCVFRSVGLRSCQQAG